MHTYNAHAHTHTCTHTTRTQVDASTKRSEFILWALEVRKKDPETLMKNDERELFKDFMEDYNTGKQICWRAIT